MKKQFFLILSKCKNTADYLTKFCYTVKELKSFYTTFQKLKNLWIFLFQYNLSTYHSAYYQGYAQNQDFFGLNNSAKYSFSWVIYHFQNTIANYLKIVPLSLVLLAFSGFSAWYIVKTLLDSKVLSKLKLRLASAMLELFVFAK